MLEKDHVLMSTGQYCSWLLDYLMFKPIMPALCWHTKNAYYAQSNTSILCLSLAWCCLTNSFTGWRSTALHTEDQLQARATWDHIFCLLCCSGLLASTVAWNQCWYSNAYRNGVWVFLSGHITTLHLKVHTQLSLEDSFQQLSLWTWQRYGQ